MKYIIFILFTVATNAAAQLMLKQGMTNLSAGVVAQDNIILKLLMIVFSPWVFFGLATFVISMASHMYVLSKVDLSFAYPFLSLAYVLVAVLAWQLFGEELGAYKIAGIAFICIGTVLIAQSGSPVKSSETDAAVVKQPPAARLSQNQTQAEELKI